MSENIHVLFVLLYCIILRKRIRATFEVFSIFPTFVPIFPTFISIISIFKSILSS